MCGRYALTTSANQLEELFEAVPSQLQEFQPNRNVTPGSVVPVVAYGRDRVPVLTSFRWGITPSWGVSNVQGASKGASKESLTGASSGTAKQTQDRVSSRLLINARSETVHQKPSFAHSFQHYRCIIPADGFYEWKASTKGGRKTPWLIDRTDGEILAMAGIFQRQRLPDGLEQISCAILTTKANTRVADIHDRMPVILNRTQTTEWISPESDPMRLRSWFAPLPADLTALHEGVDPLSEFPSP